MLWIIRDYVNSDTGLRYATGGPSKTSYTDITSLVAYLTRAYGKDIQPMYDEEIQSKQIGYVVKGRTEAYKAPNVDKRRFNREVWVTVFKSDPRCLGGGLYGFSEEGV